MIGFVLALMLMRQATTLGWTSTEPCPCCEVGFYKVGTTDEWRMSHAEQFPECMASWAEQHCVAVLVEAHDVEHHSEIIYGDLMPGKWGAGQHWTEHIPEQTLKLRCKR